MDKGIENARRGNIIEKKLKKIRQRSGWKEIRLNKNKKKIKGNSKDIISFRLFTANWKSEELNEKAPAKFPTQEKIKIVKSC